MKKVLEDKFFERDTNKVAKDLIGKILVREIGGKRESLEINEVEAYLGENDSASHARFGKSKRSSMMYGSPGTLYIYLVYGMYEMLNIVCGKKSNPQAVLIRGAGKYDGPGKLTRALKIGRGLNGKKMGEGAGLWIEKSEVNNVEIKEAPRIGIKYADKKDREAKLRFIKKVSND